MPMGGVWIERFPVRERRDLKNRCQVNRKCLKSSLSYAAGIYMDKIQWKESFRFLIAIFR